METDAILKRECRTLMQMAQGWHCPTDMQALAMLTVGLGLLQTIYGAAGAQMARDFIASATEGQAADTLQ